MHPRPVAGCLFEVHLPPLTGGWAWTGGTDAVTLLATTPGRFRFRAERGGPVVLRFESPAADGPAAELRVPLRIVPADA